LLAGDAQTEFPSGKRANRKLDGLRSVLCVPIRHKDEILGAVYVDNRCQNGVFNQADLELLESIASSAGIAIENARLYQLAVERGRVERELQMARAVQAGLIPTDTPKIPGWELAAYWRPAHEVGGDFYDFVALPDGRTGIVVADVSDKGMPAAIFMALTRSILRAAAGQNNSPAADIAQASRLIWHDSAAEMYVTLCYPACRRAMAGWFTSMPGITRRCCFALPAEKSRNWNAPAWRPVWRAIRSIRKAAWN
jgi:sigma-B regulation protein RsbU (phosphoserine phosphatase)